MIVETHLDAESFVKPYMERLSAATTGVFCVLETESYAVSEELATLCIIKPETIRHSYYLFQFETTDSCAEFVSMLNGYHLDNDVRLSFYQRGITLTFNQATEKSPS